MIRVVIADDEPVIVRSLKAAIENSGIGYEVVGTAYDGRTAIQLIETLKPDIVFTDVRMPVLGGLEMLEELRKKGNQIPAVVLSGYQEFQYAKRSIQLGVIDYLVKPLNPLTLNEFLRKLADTILDETYRRQKEYLEALLHDREYIWQGSDISGQENRFYIIKCVIDSYNFFRNNQFLNGSVGEYAAFMEETGKKRFGKEIFFLTRGKYENEFTLFVKSNSRNKNQHFKEMYEEIVCGLGGGHHLTMVVSDAAVKSEEIKKKAINLDSLLCSLSIYGQSNFILETQSEKKVPVTKKSTAVDFTYISHMMEQQRMELVFHEIDEILERCEREKCVQTELVLILRKLIRILCKEISEYELDFILNLTLVNSPSYDILKDKFKEVIREYGDMSNTPQASGADYIVEQIKRYLDEQYRNKIVIGDIAEKFGLNHPYLCSVFRKEYGISPNEYLIWKRIEEAKKLLSGKRELSIRDIAQMVGYEDQYYFSRLFKSVEKISPKEYRKQMEEKKL